MKSDWDRIQDIFAMALAQPPSERKQFVEKACAGKSYLKEVISLLEAYDSEEGILESPVFPVAHERVDPAATIGGRYVIERRLGKGGMGEVYLARDANVDDRGVVIKVLAEELRANLAARQRFIQETRALAQIRHEGVVDVLDSGELDDGRPYFVMQYIEGEMLRSQIPVQGMNLERAASILKQIGAALDHVHERGIFHRDLKPENIMLRKGSGAVVLIDFGIAKVHDPNNAQLTAPGVSPGTLPYMSPEQLRGDDVTAASDVYAMAVVAYEMITGRRPFYSESITQMRNLQRKGVRAKPVDLRPGVSRKAQAVLCRALSFKPEDRHRNAKQFGDELAAALLNPETLPVPGDPWPTRKKIAAIVSAVVLLSLIGFGVYKWIYLPPSPPPPSRGVDYWLTIQPTRDGKEYGDPYKSKGDDDIFANGDKFQLSVESQDEPGHLYVFHEGQPEAGSVSFRMIYPNKAVNNASAGLGANQTVKCEWLTFRGPAGAENVWIVWSVSPVSELEAAKNSALNHPQAGLTDQSLDALKEFLRKQPKADIRRYKERREATIRTKSDLAVALVQFNHH